MPLRSFTTTSPRPSLNSYPVLTSTSPGSRASPTAGRGSRKDFVDLYFYLKSSGSLGSILALLKKRFTAIDYNEYHLLKSLVFFDDAEKEPMPNMIRLVDWEEVKKIIIKLRKTLNPQQVLLI